MREKKEELTRNTEPTKEDKSDGVKWVESGRTVEATGRTVQVRDG